MFHLLHTRRSESCSPQTAVADPAPTVSGLLSAPMLIHALGLERKRAERSGHFFVLMLLDPRLDVRTDGDAALLDAVVAAVLSSVRETDICGWHAADRVLGVIFTELGGYERRSALAAIRSRLTAALEGALPVWAVRRVEMSFHVYPDEASASSSGPPVIAALFPDLVQRDASRRISRVMKRALDATISALVLLGLAPLVLAIAAAIKVSSPGPVLFRQQRIGRYGVPFTFLKFRSMHARNDAEIHRAFATQFIRGAGPAGVRTTGEPVYKLTTDPRITPVGRWLRRTSLDELPQLINVLTGRMSLVGPRPPIPYELEAYEVWHRRRLQEVKPGITGLWQVSGRSRLPFDDMVRLDLRYASAWSIWLDVKILLRTPRAVLTGDGAY